jgi:hypothetical protein
MFHFYIPEGICFAAFVAWGMALNSTTIPVVWGCYVVVFTATALKIVFRSSEFNFCADKTFFITYENAFFL